MAQKRDYCRLSNFKKHTWIVKSSQAKGFWLIESTLLGQLLHGVAICRKSGAAHGPWMGRLVGRCSFFMPAARPRPSNLWGLTALRVQDSMFGRTTCLDRSMRKRDQFLSKVDFLFRTAVAAMCAQHDPRGGCRPRVVWFGDWLLCRSVLEDPCTGNLDLRGKEGQGLCHDHFYKALTVGWRPSPVCWRPSLLGWTSTKCFMTQAVRHHLQNLLAGIRDTPLNKNTGKRLS